MNLRGTRLSDGSVVAERWEQREDGSYVRSVARLTDAEWEAELARAKGVQAKDVDRLITRTPRKRSRWGRPWERRR